MLKLKKLDTANATLPQIGEMLLTAVPEPQKIDCLNWPVEWPAKPETTFRAAHNGREILLRFDVQEPCTMALVERDNGEVWTDSAVEFFISFDDTGYYNFEFTCIGRALAGFRKVKPEPRHATPEVMATIHRYSSLGSATFAECHLPQGWSLVVAIPLEALFAHNFTTLDGVQACANVYKCGDNLSQAHFVTWRPIETPTPNFHQPAFFDSLIFEK